MVINSYKSIWYFDPRTGNYLRHQKTRYPLGALGALASSKTLSRLGLSRLGELLGERSQGLDFYQYYREFIESGNRSKWAGQFDDFLVESRALVEPSEGLRLLDVSGEPGFFVSDAKVHGIRATVTAPNREVAIAIEENLGVPAQVFNYQEDHLSEIFPSQTFELITIRYSIGFCRDLQAFIKDLRSVLSDGGVVNISYSPASRGVIARWMFDDYTYLTQYSKRFVIESFRDLGFELVGEFDHGSYPWFKDMHPAKVVMALPYLRKIFPKGSPEEERSQHNISQYFRLTDSKR